MAKPREAPAKSDLGQYLAIHRGALSVRKAADRAGISEGRWRQVEAGYESKGGMRLPVNAKPDTVAAMARAVGAEVAEALQLAGHRASDYPELLADPASTSDDAVRDAIGRAPLLGPDGRERVLHVYDFEVARETQARGA